MRSPDFSESAASRRMLQAGEMVDEVPYLRYPAEGHMYGKAGGHGLLFVEVAGEQSLCKGREFESSPAFRFRSKSVV